LVKDANGVFKSIYELEETLPDKVVNAIEAKIDEMQKDFEAFVDEAGDDEKAISRERARMEGQFKRITNEAVNLRTNLMKMTESAGDWDVENIKASNIDPLKSVLSGGLKDLDANDNVTVTFDEKGKLTFNTQNYSGDLEVPMRSFNSDQMIEMLPYKDAGYMAGSVGQLKDMTALGMSDAVDGTYNYNDQMATNQANAYTSRIKTKREFQNASRQQRDGAIIIPALKDSLMERVDIPLHVLNTIFKTEDGETIPVGEKLFAILNVAKDGDQVLDEKDLKKGLSGKNKEAYKAAYDQLIDVYTNTENPSFNLDNSLVLLGQHNEAYSKQHYDVAFEAKGGKIPGKYYAPKPSGKTANYIINNTNVNPVTWNNSYVPFINKSSKAKEGDTFSSPTGYKYKFENGKYYVQTGVNEYDTSNPMDFHQFAVFEGWDNYVDSKKQVNKRLALSGELPGSVKPKPE
jgi:hypothetical protein